MGPMHTLDWLRVFGMATFVLSCARHEATEASRSVGGDSTPSSVPRAASGLESSASTRIAEALPEQAGPFTASAMMSDPRFVRRTYSRGAARISVTIAIPDITPLAYEDWVRMSADSPQVTLNVPANSGAGFYDCAGKDLRGSCNVHIHFRAGYHVELMGEHAAYRAEFDDLLAALPLRRLVQQ
jgi:hypothetical protein